MLINQINKSDRYFLEIINIYYKWWSNIQNKKYSDIYEKYITSLTSSLLPKIYALIINDTLIGTYSLEEKDNIDNEPYTPYLANVYIKEKYRHQGYSKLLIEDAKEKAILLGYKDLYLHTKINNYYEKFGFKFLKEVNTPYGNKRIYICHLKNKN